MRVVSDSEELGLDLSQHNEVAASIETAQVKYKNGNKVTKQLEEVSN